MSKVVYVTLFLFCLAVTSASAAPRAKLIEFWNDYEQGSRLNIDHSRWDALLKKHVITGHSSGINRIDYAKFSDSDKASLSEYLKYLQAMDPRQLSRDSQKAFWLNLYNAGIVSLVLKESLEDSIKNLGGVWKKKRFYITMQKTSFDDIQHGILRPVFDDKRLLVALNAGTMGSAGIQSEAFTADNVEGLLDVVVSDFLAQSNGLKLEEDKLILSRTFKWYARDYGNRRELLEFLSQYVPDELVSTIKQVKRVEYQYDWALNKP